MLKKKLSGWFESWVAKIFFGHLHGLEKLNCRQGRWLLFFLKIFRSSVLFYTTCSFWNNNTLTLKSTWCMSRQNTNQKGDKKLNFGCKLCTNVERSIGRLRWAYTRMESYVCRSFCSHTRYNESKRFWSKLKGKVSTSVNNYLRLDYTSRARNLQTNVCEFVIALSKRVRASLAIY